MFSLLKQPSSRFVTICENSGKKTWGNKTRFNTVEEVIGKPMVDNWNYINSNGK